MKPVLKIVIFLIFLVLLVNVGIFYFYLSHKAPKVDPGLFEIGSLEGYLGNNSVTINPDSVIINSNRGSITTLTFPLTFYKNASDVDFELGCFTPDADLLRMDAYYRPDEEGKYKTASVSYENSSYGMFGYFGFGSAKPFILSNNQDFGTHIDYINGGSARILLFPSASTKEKGQILKEEKFKCTLTIVSRSPPELKKHDFNITYVN